MAKTPAPALWIGTSGWTYDDWNGVFYLPEVKGADRLSFYATQFNAVELNATFYRYPTEAMVAAWNRRLPDGFHLAVKASRRITHFKRLHDCEAEVAEFFRRIRVLKALRVILWQLPSSFQVDLECLDNFLTLLERCALPNVQHAFEFRHADWWSSAADELLRKRNAAFVTVSHPRLPSTIKVTADFLYVRFHGLGTQLYRYDYSEEELAEWAERIRAVCENDGIKDIYVFFNNDFRAHAIHNARLLRQMLTSCLDG